MNDDLAHYLKLACEGERADVVNFLRQFQNAKIAVPERNQSPAFRDLPPYPSRPLEILAVRDDQHVTVPVFTHESLIEPWAGRILSFRHFKVGDLVSLLPEDWWLTLNPGDEIRKDFTPWELQRLLGTDEDLLEIATELESDYGVQPLDVRRLQEQEFTELRAALADFFKVQPEITALFLALERGVTVENSPIETLLVGVRIRDLAPPQAETIRTKVKDLLGPYLIGSIGLRVLLGVGFSDLELGVFADWKSELARS